MTNSHVIIDADWEDYVKRLLQVELTKKGMKYPDLAKKLSEIGIDEKPENINNKINRGSFRAVFLIQCLKAIGCKSLPIELEM